MLTARNTMRRAGMAVAVPGLVACLWAAPATAQAIEPEADKMLHGMTDYVAGLKAFTVDYDVDNEVVDTAGRKLQYSASGSLALERPGKLHLARKGAFVDAEVTFDGSTISILGKKLNIYAQLPSPGPTIDDAVNEIRAVTDLDASGADLFAADSYAVLTDEVTEGVHVGTGFVDGVECDHLAYRNPRVDWQIWIAKGDKPVPLKYVITTKWVTGAPQYALRLRNWNTSPQIAPDLFTFTAPEGATKLETLQVDAIGEFGAEAQP